MGIRFPQNNKYFPKDTYEIFSSLKEVDEFAEYNFYFLFNTSVIKEKEDKIEEIKINDEIKNFKWDSKFFKILRQRKDKIVEELKNNGFSFISFKARCLWRLIIGLGAPHPQETSMTLHHIYGIPYIPGSAIKGITRHWIIQKFAERITQSGEKEFEEAIEEIEKYLEKGVNKDINVNNTKFEDLMNIFGTQKHQGRVIFMDAYPIDNVNLKIDIINPHYLEYYSGKDFPADWQNPKPIKFLTVDERTKFQFYLLSKEEDENLLKIASEWLKDALKNYGIGAKTSLGYGLLEIL